MFYSGVFIFSFLLVHGICDNQQINPKIDKITKTFKSLPISKHFGNDKFEAIKSSNTEAVLKEHLHCNDKFTESLNSMHNKSECNDI